LKPLISRACKSPFCFAEVENFGRCGGGEKSGGRERKRRGFHRAWGERGKYEVRSASGSRMEEDILTTAPLGGFISEKTK
jgi:hypothetical protein